MKNRAARKSPVSGDACVGVTRPFRGRMTSAFTVMALAAALVGGTMGSVAPAHAQSADQTSDSMTFDPLEPFNRTMHGVNYVADHVFLRPIAYAYRDGVPDVVRSKVTNTLRNLKSPVVLANDLLQGEWDRAGDTSMRFLINSTVGLLGIFDVATDWGYPYHQEDFGQTLAVAGIGDGPYLVLPLLGPSNSRDAVGTAVDWFFDPLRLYGATQNPSWDPEVAYTRTGTAAVDGQSRRLEALEELERSSLDTYATYRSAYGQLRQRQIDNVSEAEASAAVSGSAFDFEENAQAK